MLRWNLDHLIKEKDFDKGVKYLESQISKLKSYKKNLKPSMSKKTFKEIVELSEHLDEKSDIIGSFLSLKQSENAKEKHLKIWEAKLNKL